MKNVFVAVLLVGLCAMLVVGCHCGSCSHKDAVQGKMQTKCPISGGPINKDCYVDAEGVRIYTCCPDCLKSVKADPKAAIEKINANGECCCLIPAGSCAAK